ncbi:MAG: nickel pincer cofactor biosynthesis protein LarB [Nitrospinota bacterium]
MNVDRLKSLLTDVGAGRVAPEEALERLRALPFTDLGFAKVDHHRPLRSGHCEVIYAEGKTEEQIQAIARELLEGGGDMVLATRVCPDSVRALESLGYPVKYHELARMAVINRRTPFSQDGGFGCIAVAAAGTADLPVAEETAFTLEVLGNRVERVYDVGVAGLHRLLDHWPVIRRARVVVAVAGMEGALPSVIGGLVGCPIIAVPTSVGYGANFGGLAALLAMLNSCAPGVSVVNIDNGFGAAVQADRINKLGSR